MKKLLLYIIFFTSAILVKAQVQDTVIDKTCITVIDKLTDKYNNMYNKADRFSFELHIQHFENGKSSTMPVSKILVSDNKLWVRNKTMEMIDDGKTQVIIMPGSKKIMILKSSKDSTDLIKQFSIPDMKKTFFETAKNIQCIGSHMDIEYKPTIKGKANPTRKISLDFNDSYQITKYKLYYQQPSKYDEVEYKNYSVAVDVFPTEARDLVLTKEGKLKPAYTKFEINDSRKSKKQQNKTKQNKIK